MHKWSNETILTFMKCKALFFFYLLLNIFLWITADEGNDNQLFAICRQTLTPQYRRNWANDIHDLFWNPLSAFWGMALLAGGTYALKKSKQPNLKPSHMNKKFPQTIWSGRAIACYSAISNLAKNLPSANVLAQSNHHSQCFLSVVFRHSFKNPKQNKLKCGWRTNSEENL